MIRLGSESKQKVREELEAQGKTAPADADLETLKQIRDAGDSTKAADVTQGDGTHPAAVVEDVPADEKPGPASVMQRELRPDEQDLPPGTSGLQQVAP